MAFAEETVSPRSMVELEIFPIEFLDDFLLRYLLMPVIPLAYQHSASPTHWRSRGGLHKPSSGRGQKDDQENVKIAHAP